MPWCPFKNCECYPECGEFVASVQRCRHAVRTMQLEDLHKVSLVLLDRILADEATPAEAARFLERAAE